MDFHHIVVFGIVGFLPFCPTLCNTLFAIGSFARKKIMTIAWILRKKSYITEKNPWIILQNFEKGFWHILDSTKFYRKTICFLKNRIFDISLWSSVLEGLQCAPPRLVYIYWIPYFFTALIVDTFCFSIYYDIYKKLSAIAILFEKKTFRFV